MGMVILTKVDARLQTPMYFFLRHLALTDLGYSTSVGPKMLVQFAVDQNKISYHLCATQLAFFIVFIISELFILAAMSYDRYAAICHPLLYTVIMSGPQRQCPSRLCASPGRHSPSPGARGARDRCKERAHLPVRLVADLSEPAGGFPRITCAWRASRGGTGVSGGAQRATRVGGTDVVVSRYRQPFGAAGLMATLDTSWLERSRAFCAAAWGC